MKAVGTLLQIEFFSSFFPLFLLRHDYLLSPQIAKQMNTNAKMNKDCVPEKGEIERDLSKLFPYQVSIPVDSRDGGNFQYPLMS